MSNPESVTGAFLPTYTDVFTAIRNLYAGLAGSEASRSDPEAFLVQHAGRAVRAFCLGKRFKDEVLRVTFHGLSISDLLDLTVQESLPLLQGRTKMDGQMALLDEVGLGYLQWGQSVRTLSGGEGQRLRLAKELSGKAKRHTLYLLDEPSTGLHPRDTRQLLVLLNKLVDAGNTVIVVEHNLDVIRECDWVIDIGPEGGAAGGEIIAAGTPEAVAAVTASHTGRFLREVLR